jgi:hypothetical protein
MTVGTAAALIFLERDKETAACGMQGSSCTHHGKVTLVRKLQRGIDYPLQRYTG